MTAIKKQSKKSNGKKPSAPAKKKAPVKQANKKVSAKKNRKKNASYFFTQSKKYNKKQTKIKSTEVE